MTLEQMRRNIRYALGLREADELPIIDQQINLGVMDVLRRTGCFVQCIDADVPDGKNRIELGPGIMRIIHVIRYGAALDRVEHSLLAYVTKAFAQTANILVFSESFAAGEALQLYAVPRPQPLINPDDALEDEQFGGIPEEFQDAVELYAKGHLADLSDDGTSQMGGAYLIAYLGPERRSGRIAEIRAEVNRGSGMTLGPAQLAYQGGRPRRGLSRSPLPLPPG